MAVPSPALERFAALHGITPRYHDVDGALVTASREVLEETLRVLGVTPPPEDKLPAALEEAREARCPRRLEPVLVLWEGAPLEITLRWPAAGAPPSMSLVIELEGGETRERMLPPESLRIDAREDGLGQAWLQLAVPLPGPLATGYHTLTLEAPRWRGNARLIVAPRSAPRVPERAWGLFLPLYALRSERGLGLGSLADLCELTRFTLERGGSLVGTTPLLPCFLDEPFVPSPYAPVTRLFWGEHYVDPRLAPEFAECAEAHRLAESPPQPDDDGRGALALVDYRLFEQRHRALLDALTRHVYERGGPRRDALEAKRRRAPELERYARFRAVTEQIRAGWPTWNETLRGGELGEMPEEARVRRHLLAQALAEEQLGAVDAIAREKEHGLGLYLDFPVGVHVDGYDVWSRPSLFARGASIGAPPDPLFRGGQNWAFPPLLPEASRAEGHEYFARCLRHHLRHAGVLRIDHVMGLHRLFFIPSGRSAREGVYVRYPAEELHAIVCLEAERAGTIVLGEDLGTVPDEVRAAMNEHRYLRMHVGQFALRGDPAHPLDTPRSDALACLNTHDTPTLTGFVAEKDVDVFEEVGCMDEDEAATERQRRRHALDALRQGLPAARGGDAALRDALQESLAESPARILMLNLEDQWLEREPQNVPGTCFERPNWRRPARRTLEEITSDPELRARLERIDELRRRSAPEGDEQDPSDRE